MTLRTNKDLKWLAPLLVVAALAGCTSLPILVRDAKPSIEGLGELLSTDQLGHFSRDREFPEQDRVMRYRSDGSFEDLRYGPPGTMEPELQGGERGTYHYDASRLSLTINVYENYSFDRKRWVRTGDRVIELIATAVFLGQTGRGEVYVRDQAEWVNVSISTHRDFDDETKREKRLARKTISAAEGPGGYRVTSAQQTSTGGSDYVDTAYREDVADLEISAGSAELPPGQVVKARLSSERSRGREYDAAARLLGDLGEWEPASFPLEVLELVNMGTYLVRLLPG